jgi:hypothetical protein
MTDDQRRFIWGSVLIVFAAVLLVLSSRRAGPPAPEDRG